MKYIKILLVLLFTFSLHLHSQDINEGDKASLEQIIKLENELKQSDISGESKIKIIKSLIQLYLKADRYQEAIWVLRENSENSQADKIETQLVDILTKEEIKVHKLLQGGENPELGKIKSKNIFVVHKENELTSSIEAAAYLMDKALGLNIVPLTILRDVGAKKKHSVQYFVQDSISAFDYFRSENPNGGLGRYSFNTHPYTVNHKNMWLLDFLFQNGDRQGKNWLLHYGKEMIRPIAIDNGDSFNRVGFIKAKVKIQEELLPSGKVLFALKKLLVADTLENLFSEYLYPSEIFMLRERIEDVIYEVDSKENVNSCHSLFK